MKNSPACAKNEWPTLGRKTDEDPTSGPEQLSKPF